jgi:hypothetical protein
MDRVRIGSPSGAASAATETVIHSFATFPLGANPYAPLTGDASGDLSEPPIKAAGQT